MENKRKNIYIIIFVITTIVAACIAIYFAILLNNNNERIDELETRLNQSSNEVENKEGKVNNGILKINIDKDVIYEADYKKDVIQESYFTSYNTYYSKDIKVPYININSEAAKKANNEIEKVFNETIEKYNIGVKDKTTFVDRCNYEYYIDDEILSVKLEVGYGATDIVKPEYYTYNFDLKTGNILSYEKIYKKLGFDSNSINNKVLKKIESEFTKYNGYTDDIEEYKSKSFKNYNDSISNNNIKFFVDNNKRINVIVKLNVPAGSGEINNSFTIE